jgi:predicted transcriptional regulator
VTNTISKKRGKNQPVKYYEVTAKGVKIIEYFRDVHEVIQTGTKVINPFSEMINKPRSTN